MADSSSSISDPVTKSNKSSDYDPALDFYSDKFDPLKALKAANIKIPVPKARLFDNLAQYQSSKRELPTEKKPKQETAPNLKFERKFEPHQMPVPSTYQRRNPKNVLTKMEQFKGPLAVLKRCVDERIRLKVWTRHSHGLRGYCLAFVIAFDKHWNLAMEDVTEVWTRPRSRKLPALGPKTNSISTSESKKTNKIIPPKVTIKKSTKKLEFCERHVPQLLLRGEQISYIVLEA